MRAFVAIAVGVILLFGTIEVAHSQTHPQCPLVSKSSGPRRDAWRKFITSPSNYFAVRFDAMPVDDQKGYTGPDDPLGTLWSGSCYTVRWFNNNAWLVGGRGETTNRREGFLAMNVQSFGGRDLADPAKYELALWGVKFKYNEAGEVRHPQLGLVGHLYCTIGGDCTRFSKAQRVK